MWLLNIHTLGLEYFEGESPAYVILSHRWTKSEVTFQEMRDEEGRSKTGFQKVSDFCAKVANIQLTIHEGYIHYVWVDTCCIDKTNSAELSEAINSMFRWYKESACCYVYLSDVHNGDQGQFERSEWFGRGWTLQELIAPSAIFFFDSSWNEFGYLVRPPAYIRRERRERSDKFADLVQGICRVPSALLLGNTGLSKYIAAERMSWASERTTTRREDIAYSLLGIFGVNMPLIYGEGVRAFHRLQEEVIRTTGDLTLLAFDVSKIQSSSPTNFLADSPSCFNLARYDPPINHGNMTFDRVLGKRLDPSITFLGHAGLSAQLFLIPYEPVRLYVAPICCSTLPRSDGTGHESVDVGILVGRISGTATFRRTLSSNGLVFASRGKLFTHPAGQLRQITLQGQQSLGRSYQGYGFQVLRIDQEVFDLFLMESCRSPAEQAYRVHLRGKSSDEMLLFQLEAGVAGFIEFQVTSSERIHLHSGFDFDFAPFYLLSRARYIGDQSHLSDEILPDCRDFVIESRRLSQSISGFHLSCFVHHDADILDTVRYMNLNQPETFSFDKDGVELCVGSRDAIWHGLFELIGRSIVVTGSRVHKENTGVTMVSTERRVRWSDLFDTEVRIAKKKDDKFDEQTMLLGVWQRSWQKAWKSGGSVVQWHCGDWQAEKLGTTARLDQHRN